MSWYNKMIKMIKNSGKTASQIADGTGIPYATIKNILTGKTKDPKLTVTIKLVNYCGGNLDDLFNEEDDEETEEDAEIREFTEEFKRLDRRGKELVMTVISHENERILSEAEKMPINKFPFSSILYDIPVSAGSGELLDESSAVIVNLSKEPPHGTDCILRISGDSMEPDYHNGDYVYVKLTEYLDYDDIGIFMYAGNIYMKMYTEKGLRSFNKKYKTIPGNSDIYCLGKVLGKLQGDVKL